MQIYAQDIDWFAYAQDRGSDAVIPHGPVCEHCGMVAETFEGGISKVVEQCQESEEFRGSVVTASKVCNPAVPDTFSGKPESLQKRVLYTASATFTGDWVDKAHIESKFVRTMQGLQVKEVGVEQLDGNLVIGGLFKSGSVPPEIPKVSISLTRTTEYVASVTEVSPEEVWRSGHTTDLLKTLFESDAAVYQGGMLMPENQATIITWQDCVGRHEAKLKQEDEEQAKREKRRREAAAGAGIVDTSSVAAAPVIVTKSRFGQGPATGTAQSAPPTSAVPAQLAAGAPQTPRPGAGDSVAPRTPARGGARSSPPAARSVGDGSPPAAAFRDGSGGRRRNPSSSPPAKSAAAKELAHNKVHKDAMAFLPEDRTCTFLLCEKEVLAGKDIDGRSWRPAASLAA